MPFKEITSFLKDCDTLVFFDVEGTQFTHKAIAIGLVAYKRINDSLEFDLTNPLKYHSYIKCDDYIGSLIENKTSITQEILEKEGKDIKDVILKISTILRHSKNKFFTYGSLDYLMISNAIDQSDETQTNFYRYIVKNKMDFHHYLSKRICDAHGQSYSLLKLLEMYNISPSGISHNPLYDAIDLANLYLSYVQNVDKDVELALENYVSNRECNNINKEIIRKILSYGLASKTELIDLIKENL